MLQSNCSHPSPEPSLLSKPTIWSVAEKVAAIVGYNPGDLLDPIVSRFGGRIIYQDINDWYNSEDGSIVVSEDGSFVIYVSNFTGPLRNRFTIAHEIGHFLLHSNFGKKSIKVARFTNTNTDRVEWEANWFAAAFLMPAEELLRDYNECNNLGVLSGKYLVSKTALEVRLKDLGR